MGLLFFEIFWNRNTGIPILLPKAKMVGIDEVIDLLLDGPSMEWNIVFRKELLLFIIVDFIVLYGADFRLSCLFRSKKFVQILLLS